MKKVALYLRVSKTGQTVENQRLALQKWAAGRGYQITVEYVDQGISGGKGRASRPQFDDMLKDAVRGKFDIVAAWSVDRLGRSMADLVNMFGELSAAQVDLYLHMQAVDTSTPSGKALLQMSGVFGEFEREMIRERVIAGLERAKIKGTKSGRPIGRPSVDSNTKQQITNLLMKGMSVRQVVRIAKSSVGTVSRIRQTLNAGGLLTT